MQNLSISVTVNFNLKKFISKTGLKESFVVSRAVAERILARAKQYCPVKTGFLRDSGYIKEVNGGWVVGFSAPYAGFVHEMPQSSLSNGLTKFLQRATIEILNEG